MLLDGGAGGAGREPGADRDWAGLGGGTGRPGLPAPPVTMDKYYMGCSVVDSDPDWIRIQWGPWFQIKEVEMTHENRKKSINFIFEVLDVLL